MTFYFGDLLPYVPELLQALWVSVYVTLIAMAVGSVLAVLLYLAKASRFAVLRGVANVYIEIFRNTPLLAQLYIVYFGLPDIGINLNPVWSAIIALTLNNAAYTAEIYRAGFESVPGGLLEAGRALGMSPRAIFLNIVLVPATRNVFPALTNQLILMFLASSIASIIGLPDLMTTVLNIDSSTGRTIEVLSVGGLMYLLSCAVMSGISRFSEARIFRWAAKANV